eukprot:CAMPEP_0113600712 /NCGR_PEP_ID=MMETSP0015_2-20120614/42849_1 /TAXON_ID=2838 /ORGANISM="Odontella" /LENGTH=1196 /DNA_ID=CAMNT_0000508979 /DNA_START=68 /DNA_END=3658 /DNA_ORIENTATION=+ /assembly_acc=CAM_ASM_000160
MAPAYPDGDDDDASSSSSSSSDSDDDFLTSGGGGGGEANREDLIRKKLLESFYGTSAAEPAVAAATAASSSSVAGGASAHQTGGGSATEGVKSGTASVTSGGGATDDALSGGRFPDRVPQGREISAATATTSAAVPPSTHPPAAHPSTSDLDSPHFSVPAFAEGHIRSSSVHALLETDESLALDIRSLDSTMQTLVYENYSKFIDATDAIRSIGQSVDSSKAGLARLRLGIDRIEAGTSAVDAALREKRDAVAEKIRVKRLLARLDALLRLPKTLRTQIDAGRYRLAARSHMSATAILGRHSAGFESLKSIEVECNAILSDMMQELRRKLLHWSGEVRRRSSPLLHRRKHMLGTDGDDTDGDDGDGGFDDDDDYYGEEGDEAGDRGDAGGGTPERQRRRGPPEPPRSVAEIFECAGTLLLFSRGDGGDVDGDSSAGGDPSLRFETGLSAAECKSLALDACGRLLERVLDAHNIQMEEEAAEEGAGDEGGPPPPAPGAHLVPTAFLDGVLESATLYGITLSGSPSAAELLANAPPAATGGDLPPRSAALGGGMTPEDLRLLTEFVSMLFGTFLGHVRMALLERSVEGEDLASRLALAAEEGGDGVAAAEEADEASFAEISAALAHLLRSVRELASGLALPEVGLDVEMASNLVDQTAEMTESIARRRVRRKFLDLRARVTRETLGPFVRDALAEPAVEEGRGKEAARVVRIVRIASVALSDGMQLVDDAVRAVLSQDSALGAPGAPVDPSIIRHAVEKDARNFGMWLASSLEVLAGLDNPDPVVTLDVRPPRGEDEAAEEGEDGAAASSRTPLEDVIPSAASGADDDYGIDDDNDSDDESTDLLENIISDLEEEASPESRSDLTLAIAELCRLAEQTVPEGMNQSIASSTEEETRAAIRAGGFFESSGPAIAAVMKACKSEVDASGGLAARFRTAASRSLQLFAASRGSDAAAFGCADVTEIARSSSTAADGDALSGTLPVAPSEKAWRILEVAKTTCIDCAAVLGGDVKSGPVPPFPEDDDAGTLIMSGRAPLGGGGGGIKGLQLDVERMFTERVQIHPHPSRLMEFDQTAVVSTVLKAAFRAMVEASRVCSFSAIGYRQMQVDCELLRHVLTHYVRDEDMSDGTNPVTGLCNLLNDTMINAGERCLDAECVGITEYYDATNGDIVTPLFIARRFMEEQEELGDDGVLSLFLIGDE